jgi:methionyl aminopeptidase
MIKIKTKEEIEILKTGGAKLAKILQELSEEVKPGVSSYFLNDKAVELMKREGGKPSFLGYTPSGANRPYPAALCLSINDEIVHGIPNEEEKIIQDGDVVTLDAGLIYEGLFTDHAVTVIVGEVESRVKELVERTREALAAGIKAARPGARVGDIGAAISKVAQSANLSIMENLTGHGVGYGVHEDPYIPNVGRAGQGEELKPGIVIAIEPMFGLGTDEIKVAPDGYTYLTADGSISAQFEHTVAITEDGPVILTKQ